ncbi:MAG: hypothetical protein CMJ20_08960 [Phycisphaeraceae bacterium]|nr:hypothetical protein [Phycisphaeraceae bacterium]
MHGNRYPFILIGLALVAGIICGMLSPVAPDTLNQLNTPAIHRDRKAIVDHKTDSTAMTAISPTPYLLPAGRSPLPQPHETFGKPMGHTQLEQAPPDRPINLDGPVVPWYQAKEYVGQTLIVESRITHRISMFPKLLIRPKRLILCRAVWRIARRMAPVTTGLFSKQDHSGAGSCDNISQTPSNPSGPCKLDHYC